jgi:CRISPR/Cas system endoribonuclease Cas6 (RAMP superfamily)
VPLFLSVSRDLAWWGPGPDPEWSARGKINRNLKINANDIILKVTTCRNLKIKANDIFYTPNPVALVMIRLCKIKTGSNVLDPSKGCGVFYDNLPTNFIKDYCEISENNVVFTIMIM